MNRIAWIKQNVNSILNELPDGVQLAAAAKTREPQEILDAIESGVKIIGENYVQEAERAQEIIGNKKPHDFAQSQVYPGRLSTKNINNINNNNNNINSSKKTNKENIFFADH